MSKNLQSTYRVRDCEPDCSECTLCAQIDQLTHSSLSHQIDERINDFKKIGKSGKDILFSELCFCILTANFSAVRGIEIQKNLSTDVVCLPQEELVDRLRKLGYRFPNIRAKYIYESRKWYAQLHDIISSYNPKEQKKLRNWLAKNIKGLGFKEASHFLRNIGFDNCAIIDFHIVDILVTHGIIIRPKSLTKRRYEEIEVILSKIAEIQGLNLAELDLYLWYLETGTVLK